MIGRATHSLYVLAGPTATGKTELAHRLAREQSWAVLSADAMLVYRGMDIGTAKPSPEERDAILYGGMDLVTPDQPFSVGAWLDHAHAFLSSIPETQLVLVVGGTGLYIKSLLYGLDPMPGADQSVRAEIQALFEREGLEGLRKAALEEAPDRYANLKDKNNPRRIQRALELARMDVPHERVWTRGSAGRIVVLTMERETLTRRIIQRVNRMYREGLLEEVRHLCERYPAWSDTARMAIGYREALAVLEGKMTKEQAQEETVRRTRRLARRQMTWFRHQLDCAPVDADNNVSSEITARGVQDVWSTHGPCRITC